MGEQSQNVRKQLEQSSFEKLHEKYDLNNVIVFGSILTEEFQAYSDVDLALLGGRALTLEELLEIELYFEDLLNRDIDVIDLHSKSVDLFVKISALNTGESIYSVDENKALELFIEELEHYYRNNEIFFEMRRRDLLS